MRKYFSRQLLAALVIDICIFLFASIITADLNNARDTQIVFGFTFILMIIIAVVAYKDHRRKLSVR